MLCRMFTHQIMKHTDQYPLLALDVSVDVVRVVGSHREMRADCESSPSTVQDGK